VPGQAGWQIAAIDAPRVGEHLPGVSFNGGLAVEATVVEMHYLETGTVVFGLGKVFGACYSALQPKPDSPCP
jgi:hypothetical protein